MKNKLYIALLALLLVGAYFVNSKSQAASAPVTWEYRTETKCSETKRINALGAEGWELVGFSISEAGLGGNWFCIFKRAK